MDFCESRLQMEKKMLRRKIAKQLWDWKNNARKSVWLSLEQDRLGKQLLDKENHKFQYKEVEKGGRAQKYYSSIEWLLSADIITTARLVTDVMYDLFYKNETTKKEIDFLTQKDGAIIPIEVKSGNSIWRCL